jgi:hypothetical protein
MVTKSELRQAGLAAAAAPAGDGIRAQQQAARRTQSELAVAERSEPTPVRTDGEGKALPATISQQVDQVSALLRGEDAAPPVVEAGQAPGEGEGEGEAPPDGEGEAPGAESDDPVTLDDVADAIGLSRRELNQVSVEVDGKAMTLGELKAKLPQLAKLEADRVAFTSERDRWGLERVDAQRRLESLIDALPREAMSREMVDRLERDYVARRDRESSLLIAAKPEWGEETYRAKARDRLAALVKPYGIERHELASVLDHRQVLILTAFADLKDRLDQADAFAKGARDIRPGAGGKVPAGQAGANTRSLTSIQKRLSRGDQLRAVEGILKATPSYKRPSR